MDQRLQQADAALKNGQRESFISIASALLTDAPDQEFRVWRNLLAQLILSGRYREAEPWTLKAIERFPLEHDSWNFRGVVLRRLQRQPEAITALQRALEIAPDHPGILPNLGNAYNDIRRGAEAEPIYRKLLKTNPDDPNLKRLLGVALRHQGKQEAAAETFREVVKRMPGNVDAWLDLIGALSDQAKPSEALEAVEAGLAANPTDQRLLRGKALLFRQFEQRAAARAMLEELVLKTPGEAWVRYELGLLICEENREEGNAHLRAAFELAPDNRDYRFALAESLDRTRGPLEAQNLDEAFRLVMGGGPTELLDPNALKVSNEVSARICAFDFRDSLGDFRTIGRRFAEAGRHTALLVQLARVRSQEDRLEFLEQHRIWGRQVEASADRLPIKRPRGPRSSGKLRIGFMSSDLRRHPVAYFALPLFEHIDRERFEVYCYSYSLHPSDQIQDYITSQVAGFRWMKTVTPMDAAQTIANDQLDMLLELGGTTFMNKLSVMAFRPAARQASWLGYPHSAGLEAIDYLVTDPYNTPTQPELLLEQPLLMPHTWIALGRQIFRDDIVLNPELPERRAGALTFGTANNPYKYNRETLNVWAQVVRQTPGSRFMFLRPESGSGIFRRNVTKVFADAGVEPNRVLFRPVRGAHLPFYNDIDISLDTFPLTGGTTTCEALWMGVPVVSMVGEAFYERLSYSILNNVGLGDLCVRDTDAFIETAVKLAQDPARRLELRSTMRDRILNGPLGQTEQFAADFYDLMAKTIQETPSRLPDLAEVKA